jgi:hypothetical protein
MPLRLIPLPLNRKGEDHAIDLVENSKVPSYLLQTISRDKLLLLCETLTQLLDRGFIQVSNSPAAAPVLFAKKLGRRLQFCINYRGLNKITMRDKYPLPRITEMLNKIA